MQATGGSGGSNIGIHTPNVSIIINMATLEWQLKTHHKAKANIGEKVRAAEY